MGQQTKMAIGSFFESVKSSSYSDLFLELFSLLLAVFFLNLIYKMKESSEEFNFIS